MATRKIGIDFHSKLPGVRSAGSVPAVGCGQKTRPDPFFVGNRGLDVGPALTVLDEIARLVQPIEPALYQSFEAVARTRMAPRDLRDWPVVALALALNLPIWTEDQDFFGSGIATWTTDRVEIYLREG